MANYAEVNEVFNEWLDEDKAPARSLVSVKELPGYTDVEIECIATI
jgi:enamine deaminase RidA (YjgF/YER057c/UK114 family)